jgi:hypothetical protein
VSFGRRPVEAVNRRHPEIEIERLEPPTPLVPHR